MNKLNLREADRLEISTLVDNYTDVLLHQGTDVMKRRDISPPVAPLAEHGLSCQIKVYAGPEERVVLMDAGRSPVCLLHNIEVFKADLGKIECVVLSHGHRDHFGCLLELLRRTRKGISLILHPDAFLQRRLNVPSIGIRDMPP